MFNIIKSLGKCKYSFYTQTIIKKGKQISKQKLNVKNKY